MGDLLGDFVSLFFAKKKKRNKVPSKSTILALQVIEAESGIIYLEWRLPANKPS
jgi:hypothetical protein